MELAEAPFLRPLVTEERPPCGKLQRRPLLPALADIGAGDAGRELRPEGRRSRAAIVEGVYLLSHEIGGFAMREGEREGGLEHRNVRRVRAEAPQHPPTRG